MKKVVASMCAAALAASGALAMSGCEAGVSSVTDKAGNSKTVKIK